MEQFTAAHRTLPFNTWVEVNNLDNGKRVNVRITDRGPFVRGRIIDLSLAAARDIDMIGPGIARVKVRVIETPRADPPAAAPQSLSSVERYAVQAGAFSDYARADSFAATLHDHFDNVHVVHTPPVWRVLIGSEASIEAAKQLAAKVRAVAGEAMVVSDR
jgi:rare lipoprotein A